MWRLGLALMLGCGAKSALPIDTRSDTELDAGRDSSGEDAGTDTGTDAGLDATVDVADSTTDAFDAGLVPLPCEAPRPVDMLVVVDASGSMIDEIRDFGAQVSTLLHDLIRPPDRDGDGVEDWSGIRDLHVAFTSTYLEGELNTTSDAPGCSGPFPRFHEYREGVDLDRFVHDATCVSTPGTRVRAGEAMFSAALRAMLPRGTPYPIDSPLGDTDNAGFLRPNSLLLLVILTDEDDYSACRLGDCDPRCGEHTCEVGSVDEYASAFRLLRESDQMIVAVIAGMPEGLTDPEEIFSVSDVAPRSEYICRTLLRGALPSPRSIGLALEFQPILESICVPDFSGIAGRLAERVGERACER